MYFAHTWSAWAKNVIIWGASQSALTPYCVISKSSKLTTKRKPSASKTRGLLAPVMKCCNRTYWGARVATFSTCYWLFVIEQSLAVVTANLVRRCLLATWSASAILYCYQSCSCWLSLLRQALVVDTVGKSWQIKWFCIYFPFNDRRCSPLCLSVVEPGVEIVDNIEAILYC